MDTPSSVGHARGDAGDYRPCWGSRFCSCCVFYDWECRISLRRLAAACLSVSQRNQILYDVFYLTWDSAFHWRVTESQEAVPILLVSEELSVWYVLNCAVFSLNQNLYSCFFPLYSKIIERCFEVCDTWSTTLLSGGHRFFLELCPRMSSKSWRRRSRPKLIMETGLFI